MYSRSVPFEGVFNIVSSDCRFLPVSAKILIDKDCRTFKVRLVDSPGEPTVELFDDGDVVGDKISKRFEKSGVACFLSATTQVDGVKGLLFGILITQVGEDIEETSTGTWVAEAEGF